MNTLKISIRSGRRVRRETNGLLDFVPLFYALAIGSVMLGVSLKSLDKDLNTNKTCN